MLNLMQVTTQRTSYSPRGFTKTTNEEHYRGTADPDVDYLVNFISMHSTSPGLLGQCRRITNEFILENAYLNEEAPSLSTLNRRLKKARDTGKLIIHYDSSHGLKDNLRQIYLPRDIKNPIELKNNIRCVKNGNEHKNLTNISLNSSKLVSKGGMGGTHQPAIIESQEKFEEKENTMKEKKVRPQKPVAPKVVKPRVHIPVNPITLNKETFEFVGYTEEDVRYWESKCKTWKLQLEKAAAWLLNTDFKHKWPKSYVSGGSLRAFINNWVIRSKTDFPRDENVKSIGTQKDPSIAAAKKNFDMIIMEFSEVDAASGLSLDEIIRKRNLHGEDADMYKTEIYFSRRRLNEKK